MDQASIHPLIAESSALLRHGIELVNTGGNLAAALDCFDRALALRRQLPVDAHPAHAYDLAACYLNRGEALLQLGAASDRSTAIEAFNAGVALLEPLSTQSEARYVRRLAVALHNRGRARAEMGNPIDAEQDFERAIDLQQVLESDLEDAAAITLHARHWLCRAYATRLSVGSDVGMAAATAATDLAEEALMVCANWERRGASRFRELCVDFFVFAAAVYGRFQPRFVAEFIQEWRDPARSGEALANDPRVVMAANDALSGRSRVWKFEIPKRL